MLVAVYGSGGRLDSSFLNRTQSVLKSIQQLAIKIEEIPRSSIKSPLGTTSRLEAGLHLSYHQVILENDHGIITNAIIAVHRPSNQALDSLSSS
jgi:hypothetical protein